MHKYSHETCMKIPGRQTYDMLNFWALDPFDMAKIC